LQVATFTVNDTNGGNNYTVNSSGTAKGTITKANLTIAAVTDTKVYDGTTTSTATPTLTGLKLGDTVSPLTQAFQSKNVLGTNGSTLQVATFTVNDNNGGNNYNVNSSGTAKGTITKASLTIAAVTDIKVYDGTTTSTATPSVTGLKDGDTVTSRAQAFQSKNVLGTGGSTLQVTTFTVNDTNGGNNYSINSSGTATGTITPATLTICPVTDTKLYDGTTTSSGTPKVQGLKTSDTVTGLSQTFASKNVLGTNGSTLKIAAFTVNDGNAGKNYNVNSSATAAGTITKRSITVTAKANTKVFDTTTSAAALPTITSGSLASGDVAGFTETYATASVGTGKTLVPTGVVNDGNGGANYNVQFVNNTAGVITPAPAAQLFFTTPPVSVIAGVAQSVVVQLADAYGNFVAKSKVAVTLTVSSGGFFVGNTQAPVTQLTVLTDAQGRATFSNLKFMSLGTYSFTASAVLESVKVQQHSNAFVISPNPLLGGQRRNI
jgi:ribulose-5-phosphate 4-epimerase/fuculose-1-phosphate aldolase